MRIIVKPYLSHLLCSPPVFKGRCGLVSFRLNDTFKAGTNINFVIVHGPHDDQVDFFADLSEVLATRAPGKTLIVGDWNIDLLPTLSSDPFRDYPKRLERHSERRLLLNAFLD